MDRNYYKTCYGGGGGGGTTRMISGRVSEELGVDMTDLMGDNVGMGVVRKQVDLSVEERQYLLAVERGDIPTVQQWLICEQVGV